MGNPSLFCSTVRQFSESYLDFFGLLLFLLLLPLEMKVVDGKSVMGLDVTRKIMQRKVNVWNWQI